MPIVMSLHIILSMGPRLPNITVIMGSLGRVNQMVPCPRQQTLNLPWFTLAGISREGSFHFTPCIRGTSWIRDPSWQVSPSQVRFAPMLINNLQQHSKSSPFFFLLKKRKTCGCSSLSAVQTMPHMPWRTWQKSLAGKCQCSMLISCQILAMHSNSNVIEAEASPILKLGCCCHRRTW